jgi:hypothetical protein
MGLEHVTRVSLSYYPSTAGFLDILRYCWIFALFPMLYPQPSPKISILVCWYSCDGIERKKKSNLLSLIIIMGTAASQASHSIPEAQSDKLASIQAKIEAFPLWNSLPLSYSKQQLLWLQRFFALKILLQDTDADMPCLYPPVKSFGMRWFCIPKPTVASKSIWASSLIMIYILESVTARMIACDAVIAITSPRSYG